MIIPGRTIEQALRQRGFSIVAGIDEVGRGAWAGPVVAAAVILPSKAALSGVGDSKAISAPRRKTLDRQIRSVAVGVGVGWVSAREVDDYGLTRAISLSGWRALLAAGLGVEAVMLDGQAAYLATELPTEVAVKADATELAVAAASIVAKVARDRYMATLARQYPHYRFERHVGYGTASHIEAIRQHGASLQHRHSYKPIQALSHVG